jgi:hypothetical protein
MGFQWWSILQSGTGEMLVEEDLARLQGSPQRLVAFKNSAIKHLNTQDLIRAFGYILVGRVYYAPELKIDAQSQQPEIKSGREGRFAGLIVEDAIMIGGQTIRYAPLGESQAQGN